MERSHRILKIKVGATDEEVKKAYTRLIKLYSPTEHPKEFMELRKARDFILANPNRIIKEPIKVSWKVIIEAYFKDKKYEELEKELKKRIIMEKDVFYSYCNLVMCYGLQGKTEEQLKFFERINGYSLEKEELEFGIEFFKKYRKDKNSTEEKVLISFIVLAYLYLLKKNSASLKRTVESIIEVYKENKFGYKEEFEKAILKLIEKLNLEKKGKLAEELSLLRAKKEDVWINGINSLTDDFYDINGYNQKGYDKEGYSREGWSREGWNREGINKSNLKKYDLSGYGKNGYNIQGYNREGYNNLGWNKDGWSRNGINKDTNELYNQLGYDKAGYDRKGWNREGINKDNFTRYDSAGYNIEGYNKFGYDKLGYNKDGYNRQGYNRNGYDKNGYSKSGYNTEGYNKSGYNQSGYNNEGYNVYGYNEQGYGKDGYSKNGYDKTGKHKNPLKTAIMSKVMAKMDIAKMAMTKLESIRIHLKTFLDFLKNNKENACKLNKI